MAEIKLAQNLLVYCLQFCISYTCSRSLTEDANIVFFLFNFLNSTVSILHKEQIIYHCVALRTVKVKGKVATVKEKLKLYL
jgi:hypothetical protein